MPELAEVLIGDEPAAWAAAGFDVGGESVAVGAGRLRFTGAVSPTGGDGRGIRSWSFAPHPPAVAAGLDLRRVREVPAPGDSPRTAQVFFRAGEVIVELVGPVRAAESGGSATEAATSYGLAFTVTDLDATTALLGAGVSPARPAAQTGRRIATLRHHELGISVPVAFLSQRDRVNTTRSEASGA